MLENNNFDEVVMKRHTAREFDPEITISKGELLQIITYATKAPSALNMQCRQRENCQCRRYQCSGNLICFGGRACRRRIRPWTI